MGFTKLDSGIVDSSIWSEPLYVRVLWITILAKSDENGFVSCSKSGLQRSANISIEEFEKALTILESPDLDSRTPDNDGRRISRIEGGWIITNYLNYRLPEISKKENRREYMREYMKNKRKEAVLTLTGVNSILTSASVSASVSASSSSSSSSSSISSIHEVGVGGTIAWEDKVSTFESYQKWELEEYENIINNQEWISGREEFHHSLDIKLSLKKAHTDFWGTKEGWKNIKKRKGNEIDWRATWVNALTMKCNQVWRNNNKSQLQPGESRIKKW
jgi:hypothetical protein